ADQSAFAGTLPHERRRLEHARIRKSVLLQTGCADGAGERVSGLVGRTGSGTLLSIRDAIVSCDRCARLRSYCQDIAREKRRAFRDDAYWARPVPGFGDPNARLLIVGLAPAAHGANRTGRVFTGDGVGGSGDFLMSALNRAGFANLTTSHRADDG